MSPLAKVRLQLARAAFVNGLRFNLNSFTRATIDKTLLNPFVAESQRRNIREVRCVCGSAP